MYFILYQEGQQWRWTLYAANNRKIANGGESYWNKADCLHAISLVRGSGSAPTVER